MDNSPAQPEERGDSNRTGEARANAADVLGWKLNPDWSWFNDEDRWRKVAGAIRILWTRPDACQQMLRTAAAVPKARRDAVYSSASDTHMLRSSEKFNPAIARKDLIGAINGGTS